jgi:hypothetical protein
MAIGVGKNGLNSKRVQPLAGGDILGAELVGSLGQAAKLGVLVAQHTGIRRAAGGCRAPQRSGVVFVDNDFVPVRVGDHRQAANGCSHWFTDELDLLLS